MSINNELLYRSIVVQTNSTQSTLPNYITVPYFHQIHWTQASMQAHRPFNATDVLASKRHWAAHAYNPRPVWHKASEAAVYSRVHLYQQCMEEEEACTFLHPQQADWPAVYRYVAWWKFYPVSLISSNAPCSLQSPFSPFLPNRASMASLFTAQPRGDWLSRCSISDVIAAGSIPLVPVEDFGPYMPFTDVLDWRAYTEVLTEDEVAAPTCTCTQFLDDGSEVVLRRDDFKEADLFATVHERNITCRCEGKTHVGVLQERYSNSKAAVLPKLQAVWRVRQVYQYSLEPDWLGVRWDAIHTLAHADDALTFSLKALMRRMCTLGLVNKCQQSAPEAADGFGWLSSRHNASRHQHPRRTWST